MEAVGTGRVGPRGSGAPGPVATGFVGPIGSGAFESGIVFAPVVVDAEGARGGAGADVPVAGRVHQKTKAPALVASAEQHSETLGRELHQWGR